MFSSKQNSLQLILYHDDFKTVNPLGNKVVKYKVSAFYFVLGNIPAKYRSRLNDINLLLSSPSALVQKYGYKEILLPVLDDILTLETTGIEIKLGGQEHTFLGTISMVVADNLAAHAQGGFYCNFSTVARFCRFCNCTRDQLHGNVEFSNFIERTQVGYNNNITDIETYPEMSSVYRIKQRSCLNSLKYFHVVDCLPRDIAHDIFEGVSIHIVCNIITGHVSEDKLFSIDFVNSKIVSFEYS